MNGPQKHVSARAENHGAMLEEALSRPGVREAMEVFGQWQEEDQKLAFYRETTKGSFQVFSAGHANPD